MEGVFWTELISAIEAIRLPRFQVADGVEWGTSGHTQVCVAECIMRFMTALPCPRTHLHGFSTGFGSFQLAATASSSCES